MLVFTLVCQGTSRRDLNSMNRSFSRAKNYRVQYFRFECNDDAVLTITGTDHSNVLGRYERIGESLIGERKSKYISHST